MLVLEAPGGLVGPLLLCGALASGQVTQRPDVVSPVVEAGRVTFNVHAPRATAVSLRCGEIDLLMSNPKPTYSETTGEWISKPQAFTRGADGVWTLGVGELPPGIYEYSFVVYGLVVQDPGRPRVDASAAASRGAVEILGPAGKPRHDEWREVPHGTVHVHWYDSKVTGSRRRLHVYTPPGYDPSSPRRYPALYLFHGNGGHDGNWTESGRANVIADNLVADGKALPLIIVMPDGHAYRPPPDGPRLENRELKRERFEGDLLQEVMPLVERTYRVKAEREQRAIAGLSMGGGQSLAGGMRHTDVFAWIGGFSSSLGEAIALVPESAEAAADFNARTRLLWFRIGRDDHKSVVKLHREFVEKLKAVGVRHEYLETDGMHTWSVWRRYLADFLPRLFRS